MDSGGDEIMISYDIGTPMYDGSLLHPNSVLGVGNGHGQQWPFGSPHPSMGTPSDASSMIESISPRTDFGLSPPWPSDGDHASMQLQEAMNTGKVAFQNNPSWC